MLHEKKLNAFFYILQSLSPRFMTACLQRNIKANSSLVTNFYLKIYGTCTSFEMSKNFGPTIRPETDVQIDTFLCFTSLFVKVRLGVLRSKRGSTTQAYSHSPDEILHLPKRKTRESLNLLVMDASNPKARLISKVCTKTKHELIRSIPINSIRLYVRT